MHLNSVFAVLILLIAASCSALKLSGSDVSFTSDTVETYLYFKKDPSVSAITITSVQVTGNGAPSNVKPGEILSVSGGSVRVGGTTDESLNNEESLNLGTSLKPSVLFFVGITGLFFGVRKSLALTALSLAVLFGTAYALTLDPSWKVTINVSVPANLKLNNFNINIAKGKIETDSGMGITIGKADISMCANSGNQISMDGFAFDSASVCATGRVWLNSITTSDKTILNVRSTEDSAHVFVKGGFTNQFQLNSTLGLALSTPCDSPNNEHYDTKYLFGNCGKNSSKITIAAQFDAFLSVAEDTIVAGLSRWSSAATWGTTGIPKNGSVVKIDAGKTILLDTTTASLVGLEIRGTLIVDPNSNFWVTSDYVDVYGTLRVGWISAPYKGIGGFTLTGSREKANYANRAPFGGFTNNGQSRGFRFFPGSNMQFHGNAPKAVYTRLNDHAKQNDTIITVDSLEGWKVGDSLAISPTTFPQTSSTDYRTIVAIDASSKKVTLNQGLSYARWGKMQYMTDKGVSLTPGVFKEMKAHHDVPEMLDERAVIVHLTRNIVIEAPNDTDWENGHGVHFMWQGQMEVQLNGVEFRRSGQAGAIGRYAVHGHMQSYNMPDGFAWPNLSDGKFLGDANKTIVRNIAIWNSKNRAIAIHGTCGARYINNVAYNIVGHAYFFEDGSEIRNHFIGNVALMIKKPNNTNMLLFTDGQASGIWLVNGDNHFRDNIVGDVNTNGFGLWNAMGQTRKYMEYINVVTPSGVTFSPNLCGLSIFTCGWDGFNLPRARESWKLTALNGTHWSVVGNLTGRLPDAKVNENYGNNTGSGSVIFFKISGAASVGSQITFSINASGYGCVGQSKWVELWPSYTPMVDYVNNTAFACNVGAQTETSASDDFGNTQVSSPTPTRDARPNSPWDGSWRKPSLFVGTRIWMNRGGYVNRILNPEYKSWTVADNLGTDLNGQVQFGLVANSLFVGNSLNNLESSLYEVERHAMASYHFALSFHNLTFFNYPPLPKSPLTTNAYMVAVPGLLQSWDLYLNSIEMGPSVSQYGLPGILNWKKFNVTQFERCPPANIEYLYNTPEYPTAYGGPDLPIINGYQSRYWTFAGALYDKTGDLAGVPESYLTYDVPFITYNLTNKRTVGRPGISHTIGTTDKMGGLQETQTDLQTSEYGNGGEAAIIFHRLDENWKSVGNWSIKDGAKSWLLGGMRHAGVISGGRYKIVHPDGQVWRNLLRISIRNADTLIIGMVWAGDVVPNISYNRQPHNSSLAVSSLSTLASTRPSYYIDASNNLVWFHHNTVNGEIKLTPA